MSKIYPHFTTGMGPDNPRNRPENIFFPATSNDGSSKTVPVASADYVQASSSLQAAWVVPLNRPSQYVQTNRVYCISRRMFPKAY